MSAVEREVKLGAWPGMALPDLTDLIEGGSVLALQPQRLTSVYLDTPDLRLARWGVTVRHRNDEGWTVKLPAEQEAVGLARHELHFNGVEGRVPVDVQHLLRALVRGATLAPVARLRTDRLRFHILDATGKSVVEIDDDEVSVLVPGLNGRGRRVAARFREIEAELLPDGEPSVLEAVVTRMRAAGVGEPDPTPKVVRALGPRAKEPPEVVAPKIVPGSSTADVIRAAIATSVARLLTHDPGVRLGADPEDVHQARVATRRLRSDLRTFREALDTEWTAQLRNELGWVAELLGAVRDADVLLERLRRQASALPATDQRPAGALVRRLEAERQADREALLAAIDGPRYAALLERLVAAASSPQLAPSAALEMAPLVAVGAGASLPVLPPPAPEVALGEQPATEVVAGLVRRPWRHLRAAVVALGDEPADEALHRVRITAKRCRYASEAAAPVVGKRAERFADAVADLQGILGDLNDAVVAEAWLRSVATRAPASQALVAGELIAAQKSEAAACRAAWKAAWKRASSKKLRSWMS